MPFSASELANIANASLDFYMKGPALAQAIQGRPLFDALRDKTKTFPGGKGLIDRNIKGDYTSAFSGYTHNDTVTYANPANIKQASYSWFEMHAGISLTHTELKKDGISVVDTNGEATSQHSDREITAITSLLDDKLNDLSEGTARSFNSIAWQDGTQDAKVFPGVQALLLGSATATTGTTGGVSRASNSWWRNRALTGASKITASAASQTLTKTLRQEVRQLRRYGGKPSLMLAGSGFINALELEVHEKGTYTLQGFTQGAATDIGMAKISMRGVGEFMYDPTLGDLGLNKLCYFIDPAHLYLMTMDGEDMKTHAPARPADQYVMYRGITWTGALICDQLNCHGVYEVA